MYLDILCGALVQEQTISSASHEMLLVFMGTPEVFGGLILCDAPVQEQTISRTSSEMFLGGEVLTGDMSMVNNFNR